MNNIIYLILRSFIMRTEECMGTSNVVVLNTLFAASLSGLLRCATTGGYLECGQRWLQTGISCMHKDVLT